MKLEPAGYIGADAFEAISGGETICQTMTPKWVAPGDVALYAIPEGYKLVRIDEAQEDQDG